MPLQTSKARTEETPVGSRSRPTTSTTGVMRWAAAANNAPPRLSPKKTRRPSLFWVVSCVCVHVQAQTRHKECVGCGCEPCPLDPRALSLRLHFVDSSHTSSLLLLALPTAKESRGKKKEASRPLLLSLNIHPPSTQHTHSGQPTTAQRSKQGKPAMVVSGSSNSKKAGQQRPLTCVNQSSLHVVYSRHIGYPYATTHHTPHLRT